MAIQEKPLIWIESSKKDLMKRCSSCTASRMKSKRGIATLQEDLEIIRARLKVAEVIAREMRDGQAPR